MKVCLFANTLSYPEGGGHLWVYLNWALGLRSVGCQVTWLEDTAPSIRRRMPPHEVQRLVAALKARLARHDLADSVALCSSSPEPLPQDAVEGCLDLEAAAEADLLLDLNYARHTEIVGRFRRSALVDIDPGLSQIWMSAEGAEHGLRQIAPHDVYFTTGETVGQPGARFPDCGLKWQYIPPVVYLPEWPVTAAEPHAPFTTVTHWRTQWLWYEGEYRLNDKRLTFLEYSDLPGLTNAHLELAVFLTRDDAHDDFEDQRLLEQKGWKIRPSWEVSRTPEAYRTYIQQSKGEFSCAKPSCMLLQNAWISDRTLCYLASGKPAVVQHTGASRFLPDAEGLFRFRTLEEAARALSAAESDCEQHGRLARALAEEYFDAQKVVGRVLERALA